jgi:hypothetical protein
VYIGVDISFTAGMRIVALCCGMATQNQVLAVTYPTTVSVRFYDVDDNQATTVTFAHTC